MVLFGNDWTTDLLLLFLFLFLSLSLLLLSISAYFKVSYSNPNAFQTWGVKVSGRDPTLMQSQLFHLLEVTLEFRTHVDDIRDAFLLDKLGQ